ncbi:GIMA2 GTPase, partial [Amia calva]|nr:GIMA2 GTPase [Amia calva]
MASTLQSPEPAAQEKCPGLSELRLVLVGSMGMGKSAAGNTILGRKEFRSETSSSSQSLKSESRAADVYGRRVTVVDTPGLFNSELSDQQLLTELERAVSLCGPGPHAFLLVLQLGRLSQQERSVMEQLEELLSDGIHQYTIVLFTHGDELDNRTIDQFIQEDENLTKLVKKCGNRYQLFDNRENSNHTQVRTLLDKIEVMVTRSKMNHYVLNEKREKDRRRNMIKIGAAGVGAAAVCGAALGGIILVPLVLTGVLTGGASIGAFIVGTGGGAATGAAVGGVIAGKLYCFKL